MIDVFHIGRCEPSMALRSAAAYRWRVNGGASLALRHRRAGILPAQRP